MRFDDILSILTARVPPDMDSEENEDYEESDDYGSKKSKGAEKSDESGESDDSVDSENYDEFMHYLFLMIP